MDTRALRPVTTQEVVSTVMILLVGVVWTISLAHSQETINIQSPRPPLFDRLHSTFPEITRLRWLVHVMPPLLALVVVWQLPGLLVCNMFTIYAVALLLRGAAFWLTRVPPPRRACTPYTFGGIYLGGCSDMMYSGHTSLLVLSALFLAVYGGHAGLSVLSVVFAFLGLALLVMTRHHYSSDILVGLYICCLAFLAFRIRPLCSTPLSSKSIFVLQF